MVRTAVRLLCLPLAVLTGAGLFVADPTTLAGAEPTTEAEVFAASADPELQAHNRALAARLGEVAVRSAYKEDLTEQLLRDRLGLAAAADGFLAVNADPATLEVMRLHFPAGDDRESAARNVLAYARQRSTAADWPKLAGRLHAEYQSAFGHPPGI